MFFQSKRWISFLFVLLFSSLISFLFGSSTNYRDWNQASSQELQLTNSDAIFQSGLARYNAGEVEDAIVLWKKALLLNREDNDLYNEVNVLDWLGSAYVSQNQYRNAINTLTELLPLIIETNDTNREVRTLANLAISHKSLGEYTTAIDLYRRAIRIAQLLPDRAREGKLLTNLGNVFQEMGDYISAKGYFQESASIAKDIGDLVGYQSALLNLGLAYAYLGNHSEALEKQELALNLARRLSDIKAKAYSLLNLGIVHHIDGDYEKAKSYYNQSLEMANSFQDLHLESSIIGSLGFLYEDLKEYSESIKYYNQGLEIARQIESPILQGRFLNNLGHVLHISGELFGAEQALNKALEILDSMRSNLNDTYNISVFDTQVSSYNLLLQILIDNKNYGRALEVAEQGRSRALVELIASRLSNRINANGLDKSPNLDRIQHIARQHEAVVVEYVLIPADEFKFRGRLRGPDSEIYIWVIYPNGEIFFRSIDLEKQLEIELIDLVSSNHKNLGGGERGLGVETSNNDYLEHSSELHQLHQVLIEPIADLLPTDPNERVVFLPHESLFSVPFPALQDSNGAYLIEKHTILTAPAIQVLDLTHQQQHKVQQADLNDILVLGNPSPMPSVPLALGDNPQQLSNLQGAEQEAIRIANLLNTDPLIGSEATKEKVLERLPNSRIVHLATHGILDDFQNRDTPGAIALAPSGDDNGLLTADEILDMQLNTELVVLSACDTGRGHITGDGVIGLSRSLIAAGVPSVVVSLWAVPDAPTATLMTEFYRNWHQQGFDKAQALRQAMLNTMKTHPHPRDWAAFTLIGEAD